MARYDPDPFENPEQLSEQTQEKLRKLSPFQKRLLEEVAIEGKSFEELSEELNIGSDTLEEHYVDALTLLREGEDI